MQQEGTPVVNLDKLTYAGNPRNLHQVRSNTRNIFSQSGECDHDLLRAFVNDNQHRAIHHSLHEVPRVEVCTRAVLLGGAFRLIRLTAGGVAPVPLRLIASEAALEGKAVSAAVIAEAATRAADGASPLPMTGYKLDLLRGVVHDLLERLAA
jgi:hypothetical protein